MLRTSGLFLVLTEHELETDHHKKKKPCFSLHSSMDSEASLPHVWKSHIPMGLCCNASNVYVAKYQTLNIKWSSQSYSL